MASSVPDVRKRAQGTAGPAWLPPVAPRTAGVAAVRHTMWQAVAGEVTGVWAASRVALLAVTYFAVLFSFGATGTQTHLIGTAPHTAYSPDAFLLSWYRWDALHFVHIATSGYNVPQDTAFFPLSPSRCGS
jgi:hypothetical protein